MHIKNSNDLSASRAGLYLALAEILAAGERPSWVSAPGIEWPLYTYASQLGSVSPAAQRAAARFSGLAGVSSRDLDLTRSDLAEPGRPRFWLYESMYFSGHLLGPELVAVEKWFQRLGVQTAGAELPHHASMELAFLAFLAENRDQYPGLEHQFIQQHPGRWLPKLGRALSQTNHKLYAPVGDLLADWFKELTHSRQDHHRAPFVPSIAQPSGCTLCGFCVQRCPFKALLIREDEENTWLMLDPRCCTGCGKCLQVCVFGVIHMAEPPVITGNANERVTLVAANRASCRTCGKAMVSQAELSYIASVLNDPEWLKDCPECRLSVKEQQI